MPRFLWFLTMGVVSILTQPVLTRLAQANCICDPFSGPEFHDPHCNVVWSFADNLAACPAGDSLLFSPPRPAQLRVSVHYEDFNCNNKVGVPPDSIYLTYATVSGNPRINDKRTQIFC
jgi:hypothetical protein